jgi:tetratricopeptide (TPR) repeat protein
MKPLAPSVDDGAFLFSSEFSSINAVNDGIPDHVSSSLTHAWRDGKVRRCRSDLGSSLGRDRDSRSNLSSGDPCSGQSRFHGPMLCWLDRSSYTSDWNPRDCNVAQRFSSFPTRRITTRLQALHDASLLHSQGRIQDAERGFQFVLETDDRNYEALYRLGLIRIQQGRFGDAANLFRRAWKVDRRSADAIHYMAVALSGLGRHKEAVSRYEEALALKPDLAEAHNNFAHSLQSLGRNDDALTHYQEALRAKPDYPEAKNNLGTVLEALDRSEEAVAQYRAALALRPGYVEARKNLARLLGSVGYHQEAATHYEQILALRPGDVDSHVGLGDLLHALDRPEDALARYRAALERDVDCVAAQVGIGNVLHLLGQTEAAIGHYQKALAFAPADVTAHSKLGDALLAMGRMAEANSAMERAASLAPRKAGYYWNLANTRRFTENDPHFAAMKRLTQEIDRLNAEERIDLHFALGKAFADIGDHRRSFEHILKGNDLMRRRVVYDEDRALGRFEQIRTTFTADLMREKAGLGDPSNTPIFIVGLPRSGTTLIEQIVASHPKVFGAGELRDMASLAEGLRGPSGAVFPEVVVAMSPAELRQRGADYVRAVQRRAPDAERITDKMPGNFALLGLIRLALPNARFIHACRDVRDTALSCFSLLFSRGQVYSYDLAELGRYCRAYLRLMTHWRDVLPDPPLQVRYEDVVEDIETQARRIIAYCGLDWDDACVEFYRTRRSVRTASAMQVRQPIYRGSIGRWRAHEESLRPLLDALE